MKLKHCKIHFTIASIAVTAAVVCSVGFWWHQPIVWICILLAFFAGLDLGSMKVDIWWRKTMIENDEHTIIALQNEYKREEQS